MITYTVTPTKHLSPYLYLHAQTDTDAHKVTIHPSASAAHLLACAAYLSGILAPPTSTPAPTH